MVVVLISGSNYTRNSLWTFDSATGDLVALVPDILPNPEKNVYDCFAGLCIGCYYDGYGNGRITATNYMTGSLAWNVTAPGLADIDSIQYMRPTLILFGFGTIDGLAMVFGVDPTNEKSWTQTVGKDAAYFLQQRGSSQVLVGSDGELVLANV